MRLRTIPVLALALGLMLFSAGPVWAAGSASGTGPVEHTYYVAPSGQGTACTASQPCQLTTARHLVRTQAPGMTGNLVINLLGGVYHLRSPFVLTSQDSGQNGYQVIWQAAPGARPVLNGGYTVHGWQLVNPTRNIWRAPVPAGLTTRQFYVDGHREQPSSGPASLLGTITQTATGYKITNTAIDHWPNLTNTEIVWTGSVSQKVGFGTWVQWRCPIASVHGDTLTMQQPCYTYATTDAGLMSADLPTSIENNLMLLNEPGQWYLDPTTHYLYYIPRPHQNLYTADTVIPVSHGLLEGNGTPSHPIHNITISGLTFQYSSWGEPSSDAGFVEDFGDAYLTASGEVDLPPGAVAFHAVHQLTFTDNTLKDLGGTGIALSGGSQNSLVAGNVITDTSASGIDLGGTGLTIDDNYIFNVAREYEGGVGIYASNVENTHISHNEIADTPYSGIALLGGIGNNHIDDNYVHDVLQSSLQDGGAIYSVGPSAPTPRSTISGNYVSGDPQPYGDIYLDLDSSNFNVTGNVIAHTGTNWIYLQYPAGEQAIDNIVTGNYTDTNTLHYRSEWNPSNIVTGNHTGLTTWPLQAQRIMRNAGLSPGYRHIKDGYPEYHDLAYHRPVTASSSAPGSTPAEVVDGNDDTSWFSQSTGHAAWITIDLGSPRQIDLIHLVTPRYLMNPYTEQQYGNRLRTPRGVDQPADREDFQVWLSNGGADRTMACSYGAPPLPVQGTLSCPVHSLHRYQYVTVMSTDGGPLAFAEIRVMGPAGRLRG